MRKRQKKRLKYLLLALLIAFGTIELALIIRHISKRDSNSATTSVSSTAPVNSTSKTGSTGFNKDLYSVNQAASLWAVVNKGRMLPSSYVPANLVVPGVPLRLSAGAEDMHLRADAATALEQLIAGGKSQNINLMLTSGYRSYGNQAVTYSGFAKTDGVAKADTYSARPGHSEHQAGLAADLEPTSRKCELQLCFASTPEGQWLAVNAFRYGFIIRYQKDKENITGYQYEPWHIRYVGKDLATQIQQTGQTLEQFFGLAIYSSYPAQSYQLSL